MDLPTYILALFEGVKSGVIDPVIAGLYYISPGVFYIALIAAVVALVFAQRKAQWVVTFLIIAAAAYLLPHAPGLLDAVMNAELPEPSIEISDGSSFEVADDALEAGANAALDTLSEAAEDAE